MHMKMPLPLHTIQRLAVQVRRLRETEELCHQWGYVYLYGGKWAGWTAAFPEPRRWCPGVVAVSSTGDVYLMVGGNDHDGANAAIPLHSDAASNVPPDIPATELPTKRNKIPFDL